VHAFDPEAWGEYFVATAGIGAALAGLVFVAFSINLREILRYPAVVGRGAESLLLLVSIALVAIVGLWPTEPRLVGVAVLVVGVVVWVGVVAILRSPVRGQGASRSQDARRIVLSQAATLPTIVAGASLALGAGPGLDPIVLGAAFSLAGGVIGAWVLLVEILR
jgi:modulator of FtsH protease